MVVGLSAGYLEGQDPIAERGTNGIVKEVSSGYTLRNRVVQGSDIMLAIAENNNN
jgi:molecular chaperone GrpE (heat shock protein)